MTISPRLRALALAAALACPSCSWSDEGEGTVTFTTYGEDFIEREIPATEFEDGWSFTYHRFLIVLGRVSVGEDRAAPAAKMAGSTLFDLKRPGNKAVARFANLPARPYPLVSYVIEPATSTTELGEGATAGDRSLMAAAGYSVYLEGTAAKGSVTKRIAWGLRTSTLYDRCRAQEAGKETDGVVVTSGGTESVELTIHGDHFFYDDLQSNDAKLRFDHLADADADADGEVTLAELAAVKLAALPAGAGSYGTGSAADIDDLRAYVEALSRTLGHFRGEGECLPRPR